MLEKKKRKTKSYLFWQERQREPALTDEWWEVEGTVSLGQLKLWQGNSWKQVSLLYTYCSTCSYITNRCVHPRPAVLYCLHLPYTINNQFTFYSCQSRHPSIKNNYFASSCFNGYSALLPTSARIYHYFLGTTL